MAQSAIRRAWEDFLRAGGQPVGVPAPLLASWSRSQAHGVHAGAARAPLADEPEIARRRMANAELLHAGRAALDRSRAFLADASSMMILTDRSGFIIETAGDRRVVDLGRRNHLERGGCWAETTMGTNAIGTALADGRAVQVSGAEHYCEDVQRWTCAAVPIRHPLDGQLVGVVDMSGPASTFTAQDSALAAAIGQEIGARLANDARREHEILLRAFMARRASWRSEDALVVDRRGILVHAADHAHRALDVASADALGREMRRLVGAADASERWARNCQERFPSVSAELVHHDGRAIGCILVINARRRPRASAVVAEADIGADAERAVTFDQIIGESPAMREARSRARKLATNTLPVLIEGETGVGKELFARAIAQASPIARAPFIPLNCGGMPRDLIASELYGYAPGAFTGADERGRAGRIEAAHGGVLCLDEIGEMPLDLQSYLLRVLEDGVVYSVGEHRGRRVDIRILSMTNRDLMAEVDAGRFRRDLYYRIAATRLRVPPLRERGDDVGLLTDTFVHNAAVRSGRQRPTVATAVRQRLDAYAWPGNVRELRNTIDVMVSLSEGTQLECEDLPPELQPATALDRPAGAGHPPMRAISTTALRAAERATILAQVDACAGNLTKAARRLGIARSTLYLKLAGYRDGASVDR